MKKIALTCLSFGFLLNAAAQSIVLDLSTGKPASWYTYSSWDIPVGTADDTWSVKVPGSAVYQNAIVSTGLDFSFALNFQNIDNNVHVISPYVYTTAQSNGASAGDLQEVVPTGQYIYRTQFYYDKACNNVTSGLFVFSTLSGGTTVTDVMLNGYSQPINATNLDFISALNNPPYTQYYFNINPGDLTNGWNSIYITVDENTPNNKGTGLMVNGGMELYYAPNYGVFNTAGSSTSLCAGVPGALNVALGTGQINSQFTLNVAGPAGNANYSLPASAPIVIYSPTTFTLTLTNNLCGLVSSTTYSVGLRTRCASRLSNPGGGTETGGSLADAVTIAPNPSSGVFSVTLDEEHNAGTLSVYDVLGNLVQKTMITGDIAEYKLDLSGLTKGIYMVNMDSDSEHVTKKIILQD